ncbi:hypothetical protein Ahy_B04g071408 isoform A [Arachis hypogaea]|uniref:Saposin B-type domain-containing protein n=1 Tax=Arachis hypogaea TaxID=3818 RepID=A0A444ZKM1_ARAHY|nr:hypothetical protein Ahy_B04g071408 isoform A [Arachis hypogaea]
MDMGELFSLERKEISLVAKSSILLGGNMEGKMGLLFLVMLCSAWACGARELPNSANSELSKKQDVCTLCAEYAAKALEYLNQNKTQSEIIEILHNTCTQLHSFERKCVTLVDYYAPLFFSEIATISPGEFCHKVNLCERTAKISLQIQENSCDFCEDAMSALLAKLKDPDTELEVIETLLKVCDTVDKYANKCKRMVFEYGPLIFNNAQKFLEKTDLFQISIFIAATETENQTIINLQPFRRCAY